MRFFGQGRAGSGAHHSLSTQRLWWLHKHVHTLFRPQLSLKFILPLELIYISQRLKLKKKKENSYPITLYQKNQTVYPAGHPGNRSPLNLFFISWYSSETSSCLTSPAVVLRVRLGFVLFFAKAERWALSQFVFCFLESEYSVGFIPSLTARFLRHEGAAQLIYTTGLSDAGLPADANPYKPTAAARGSNILMKEHPSSTQELDKARSGYIHSTRAHLVHIANTWTPMPT